MNIETPEIEDTVSTLYARLRSMAASFVFKPGERINESALSRDLGASRTPLREALNRLVAEGFVEFHPGRGFSCRALSETRIRHLYQARVAIECEAVRQAAVHSDADHLSALEAYLDATGAEYGTCADPIRLMELDETFHIKLCATSGNPELEGMLTNIYDKIRFVRTADLRRLQAEGRATAQGHLDILAMVRSGDAEGASGAMRAHIENRAQHAAEAVRQAYADLYAPRESAE